MENEYIDCYRQAYLLWNKLSLLYKEDDWLSEMEDFFYILLDSLWYNISEEEKVTFINEMLKTDNAS